MWILNISQPAEAAVISHLQKSDYWYLLYHLWPCVINLHVAI